MKYDSVCSNAAVMPGVRKMSLGSVLIAHRINSVDNKGTLGAATKPASFAIVAGVHP
jgi:hypothetical protein